MLLLITTFRKLGGIPQASNQTHKIEISDLVQQNFILWNAKLRIVK